MTAYTNNNLVHKVTGLTSGTTYKFRFLAANAETNSDHSDSVEFSAIDEPAAPSAPAIMRDFSNNTQIAVQWGSVNLVHGYLLYAM